MNLYVRKCKLMGSSFELGVVAEGRTSADKLLKIGIEEIERIEEVLSEFKLESETSIINDNAGKGAVAISEEVYDLIDRSIRISRLTQGRFDISVGSLKKLYKFDNAEFTFPLKSDIDIALGKVGYDKIHLLANSKSIALERAGMRISFAAIGKGYAADTVKKCWQEHGVQAGYINASGDLTAFGNNAIGKPWKIGIANPDNRNEVLFYVPLNNASAATSGDYEQYFLYKGNRYSHTINPKSGLPVRGIKSVSIFSPSAELSDALATGVYTMGVKHGIEFVNQLPQTHAILIDDRNKVFFSNNLQYETVS